MPVSAPLSVDLKKPVRDLHLNHRANDAAEPFQVIGVEGWFAADWRGRAGHLGTGWMFWSRHPFDRLPRGLVSVLSSHLGRQFDRYPSWLDGLRTAVCATHRDGRALVTAEGTTTHPFVLRLARLLGTDRVVLRTLPRGCRLNQLPIGTEQSYSVEHDIYFQPPFAGDTENNESVDGPLIRGSDEVRLLSVKAKGKIFRAVAERLQTRQEHPNVWLLHDRELTQQRVREQLLNWGSLDWLLYADAEQHMANQQSAGQVHSRSASSVNLEHPYLLHCTRAQTISQSEGQPLGNEIDNLLFGDAPDAFQGPLRTLIQILVDGRIRATHRLTGGKRPVVCLTSARLDELRAMRCYRPHLARWDFEPYGIALKQDAAQRLGAREVTYMDESGTANIDEKDREFLQKAKSVIGGTTIDWSREREWRMADDLDLRKLAVDDLFVFVPNAAAAERVAAFSRWPVVVFPS